MIYSPRDPIILLKGVFGSESLDMIQTSKATVEDAAKRAQCWKRMAVCCQGRNKKISLLDKETSRSVCTCMVRTSLSSYQFLQDKL